MRINSSEISNTYPKNLFSLEEKTDKDKNEGLLIIISIYIALKPLYLWSSGSLQVSDIFMLLGLGYVIVAKSGKLSLNRPSSKLMMLFFVTVLYQAAVNGIWSSIIGVNISKSTLYYLFNMLAVLLTLLVLQDCKRQKAAKYILWGCFVSLLITSIGLLLGMGGVRRLGFFNNPNQLGYYAILILSMFLFYYESANAFLKLSIFFMSVWAILASGSKAAMVGAGFVVSSYVVFGKGRVGHSFNKMHIKIAFLAMIAIFVYILFFSESSFVLSNRTLFFVRRRMLSMTTESDSSLGESRGYNRIFELGANFLWGMGEGFYSRFTTMSGLEAHSSYVTLIVSYGLFGFFRYVLLFWRFISYRPFLRNNLIIMSGIMLYGITHNGLRNTLLWILLAIMFSQRWLDVVEQESIPINIARQTKQGIL